MRYIWEHFETNSEEKQQFVNEINDFLNTIDDDFICVLTGEIEKSLQEFCQWQNTICEYSEGVQGKVMPSNDGLTYLFIKVCKDGTEKSYLLLAKETIVHELTHAQQKRDYPEIFDTEHDDPIIRVGEFIWNEYFACYKAGMKFKECAICFRSIYIDSIEQNYNLYSNKQLSKEDAVNVICRELAYLLGYLKVDEIYCDIQIDKKFFRIYETTINELAIELNNLESIGCASWTSPSYLYCVGQIACNLANLLTTD